MKSLKIYSIVILVGLTFAACSLDTDNEQMAPAYTSLNNLSDLRATAANLYLQPWYEYHKRFYLLGDARANNLLQTNTNYGELNAQGTFNEALSVATVQRPWASFYNVITQADYIVNDYCPYCVEHGVCSQADADAVAGEARFMRAMAYYMLAIYWHNVPIVDNPTTVSALAYPNPFEDVLYYAILDATFAAEHLSDKPYEIGRVSRVSALTLLSRLYLTLGAYAKGGHMTSSQSPAATISANSYFQLADSTATDAITDAAACGYGLMEDYEEMFRVQNNNCKEVLFAIQFVPQNITTGLANDIGANLSYRYCVVNRYGKAWSTSVSYDFVNVAHSRGGMSRTRGNIFLPGTTYSYLFHEMDNDDERRDCKEHEKGSVWVVENMTSPLPIKKQVVGGPMATGGVATNGNSGFCTPMLRLAEAYLNQSEARLMLSGSESSSDATVLEGINTIRRRAFRMERERGVYGDGLQWHDYTTINLDTLLQERRMEFFLEGINWADIVRRSFYSDADMQWALNYNNNRLKDMTADPTAGCYRQYKYSYTKPADVDNEVGTVKIATSGTICYREAKECTKENLWSMIYPPSELALDPNLGKAPVPYEFK